LNATVRENEAKMRWVEPIAISLLLPAIGYVIDASDPFFIAYRFPWLVLAPVFSSLRYGFLSGVTSSALLIVMISVAFYQGLPQVPFFPNEMIVGILLLTVISAEFNESWARKIKLLDRQYNHLKVRMDKFARSYHLIKGSHYQLEQHLASQVKSLRLSLLDLKKKILFLENASGEPLAGIGENILKILGSYLNVQIAGIYAVNERREIGTNPVASLGQPRTVSALDPVIAEALRTGHVASVEVEKNDPAAAVESLVAIPLVDVYQKIWAVVVVNEMPLFALQESTMDFLAVLGGKMGDLIKRRAESHCNDNGITVFEGKLRRILEEVRDLKTSAVAIAAVISSDELKGKLLSKFQTELRGVDEILIVHDTPDHQVFMMLLPYTDEKGGKEFLKRVELSRLSPETIYHRPDAAMCISDSNIRVCMWLLDNKSSLEKILPGIDQFCTGGFTDIKIRENQNEGILHSA
jgi:hypothetical protein